MRKKNRSTSALSIKTAAIIFTSVLLCIGINDWNYMYTYWEIKTNNIKEVETNCVSIEIDRTDEPNGHTPYRRIYSFVLGDSTVLSVYKDTIDKSSVSKEMLEQQLLTGHTIKFTYVPKKVFTNGAFVLISASDGSTNIIHATDVIHSYYSRVRTGVTILLVFLVVSLIILLIPRVSYLHTQSKRRTRKRKKWHDVPN